MIDLLEKTGAYLEAGRRAHQEGDADRSMRNLQRIERRDPAYGEACTLLSEILAARGDADLAASKLAEAIEEAGGEDAPGELHERHARLLEQAGQRQQALEAYEALRRRDPARATSHSTSRCLRRDLEATRLGADAATRAAGARPRAATRSRESSGAAEWGSCFGRATSGWGASWR